MRATSSQWKQRQMNNKTARFRRPTFIVRQNRTQKSDDFWSVDLLGQSRNVCIFRDGIGQFFKTKCRAVIGQLRLFLMTK